MSPIFRYGNNGCRRTYLSSRDLSAHINHRHSSKSGGEKADKPKVDDSLRNVVNSISKASLASVVAAVNNAASTYSQSGYGATPTSLHSGVPGQIDNHGMNIQVHMIYRTEKPHAPSLCRPVAY